MDANTLSTPKRKYWVPTFDTVFLGVLVLVCITSVVDFALMLNQHYSYKAYESLLLEQAKLLADPKHEARAWTTLGELPITKQLIYVEISDPTKTAPQIIINKKHWLFANSERVITASNHFTIKTQRGLDQYRKPLMIASVFTNPKTVFDQFCTLMLVASAAAFGYWIAVNARNTRYHFVG